MKKSVLLSVLLSVGVLVGGFAIAYAAGTFNAIQQGFQQGGEGQAAKLTMQVEAGSGDPNSDFLPDSQIGTSPGGALDFAITNNSDFPIRVLQLAQTTVPCGNNTTCPVQSSNKNGDGSYQPPPASGNCVSYLGVTLPQSATGGFVSWPTIAPHSTLQVNGTDNNALGAGMIHLSGATPNGCQGARFAVGLTVTATEVTGEGLVP